MSQKTTLEPEQIAAMFVVSEGKNRDNMLLKCIYFLGLRSNEIRNMKIEDIDFNRGVVFVGKKKRSVTIPEGFLKELEEFVSNKNGIIFTGRSNGLLSDRHVRRLVKKYAQLAKCPNSEEINTHSLRYSCNSHLEKL